MKSIDISFDLGTSRTVVYCKTSRCSEVFRFNNNYYVPSLIAYNGTDFVFGDAANEIMKFSPHMAILHWKRCIMNNADVKINNNYNTAPLVSHGKSNAFKIEYPGRDPIFKTPMECLEIFVTLLLRTIQKYYKEEVRGICVATPVQYSIFENNRICDCVKKIAKCDVSIVNEPVAAALSVKYKGNGYFLVYDFGGGTFDAAIVQYNAIGNYYYVVKKGGVSVGGDDIDHAFADYILNNYLSDYKDEIMTKDNEMYYRSMVETMKIELSQDDSTEKSYSTFLRYLDDDDGIEVGRDEFEKIAEKYIDETLKCVEELVRGCEISKIILVGGSSQIPLVQEKLRSLFHVSSNDFFYRADSTTAVAEGGYLYLTGIRSAANQFGTGKKDYSNIGANERIEPTVRKDSIAADIGILAGEDHFYKLFKRGLVLGSVSKFAFKKLNTFNETFRIEFAQGLSNIFSRNTHFATFKSNPTKSSEFIATVTVDSVSEISLVVVDSDDREIGGTLEYDNQNENGIVIDVVGNLSDEEVYVDEKIEEEKLEKKSGVNESEEVLKLIDYLNEREDDMDNYQFSKFNDYKKSYYYVTRDIHKIYNTLLELGREFGYMER